MNQDGTSQSATQATANAVGLDKPQTSPAELRFALVDPAAGQHDVVVEFRSSPEQEYRPLRLISTDSTNPSLNQLTSAPNNGALHRKSWDFAHPSQLGDGSFEDIVLRIQVVGGATVETTLPRVGNRPPELSQLTILGDSSPVTLLVTIVDSTSDPVNLDIEYALPTEPYRLISVPGVPKEKPLFAGVITTPGGNATAISWEAEADLAGLDTGVQLRLTTTDGFGPPAVLEQQVVLDNNHPPEILLLSASSTDRRRIVPISYILSDPEGDAIDLLFQWTLQGEEFPVLPSAPLELRSLLEEEQQANQLRICRQRSRERSGFLGVLPQGLDPRFQVHLPELLGSASDLLSLQDQWHELELLRCSRVAQPLPWKDLPERNAVAAVPLGRGLNALLLDSVELGWSLLEVELTTGAIVREVASGPGRATALALSPDESAVFVAEVQGDIWTVHRLDPVGGETLGRLSANATTAGVIRGLDSASDAIAYVTAGDAVHQLRFGASSAVQTIARNLQTPWGVAYSPVQNVLYVAETKAGRILRLEPDRHTWSPLKLSLPGSSHPQREFDESASTPRFSPRALAFEAPETLLVVADGAGAPTRLFEVQLRKQMPEKRGGREFLGQAGLSLEAVPVEGFLQRSGSLAVGRTHLRMITFADSAPLAAGGVEQVRPVDSTVPASVESPVVTVAESFAIPPRIGQRWQLNARERTAAPSSPMGEQGAFLWDTDLAENPTGDLLVRALPMDNDLGLESSVTVSVQGIFSQQADQQLVATPQPIEILASDLDGDGDLDIVTADRETLPKNTSRLSVFFRQGGSYRKQELTHVFVDDVRGLDCTDLDGDGLKEILAISHQRLGILIFEQTVPGQFFDVPQEVCLRDRCLQPFAVSLAHGDFNDDGLPDLVTISAPTQLSDFATVSLQRPGLEFPMEDAVRLGAGLLFGPSSVTAGDVNADGFLDVVITNELRNEVSCFLRDNSNTESFVYFQGPTGLDEPVHVTCRDLDRDGLDDLVVANGERDYAVFFQTSPALFSAPILLSAPTILRPQSTEAADLDGNGLLDVVTVNQIGGVLIFYQTQPRAFRPEPAGVFGADLADAEVADIDANGHPDLLVCNELEATASIFLQRRSGKPSWTAAQPLRDIGLVGPRSQAIADFDGNGLLDLATANQGAAGCGDDNVTFYLQKQAGQFSLLPDLVVTAPLLCDPFDLLVADWDGDGDLDLATASVPLSGEAPGVQLLIQDAGDFDVFSTGLVFEAHDTLTLAQGDLNSDGTADLVVARVAFPAGELQVVLQDDRGNLSKPPIVLGAKDPTIVPVDVTVADWNRDEAMDLVCCNLQATVSLFTQDPTAPLQPDFEAPVTLNCTAFAQSPRIVDVDRDGLHDVVVVTVAGTVEIFFQKQTGRFPKSAEVLDLSPDLPLNSFAVDIGDLDGNGLPDLVVGSAGQIQILYQDQPRRFSSDPTTLGSTLPAFLARRVQVVDLDGDQDDDIVAVNSGTDSIQIFYGNHQY